MREEAIKTLKRYITKDMKVLDLGAKNSKIAKALEWERYDLVDVDWDEDLKLIDHANYWTAAAQHFIECIKIKYDFIILSLFLEHIPHPFDFLTKLSQILKKDGLIYIRYPNAKSINRLIGVEMGILGNPYELSNADIKHGHVRMYDYSFTNRILEYFYDVYEFVDEGGYMFKPLPLKDMDKYFGHMLDVFIEIGYKLPIGVCGEIWIILKKI